MHYESTNRTIDACGHREMLHLSHGIEQLGDTQVKGIEKRLNRIIALKISHTIQK